MVYFTTKKLQAIFNFITYTEHFPKQVKKIRNTFKKQRKEYTRLGYTEPPSPSQTHEFINLKDMKIMTIHNSQDGTKRKSSSPFKIDYHKVHCQHIIEQSTPLPTLLPTISLKRTVLR